MLPTGQSEGILMGEPHLYLEQAAPASVQKSWETGTPWPIPVAIPFIAALSLGMWVIIWKLASALLRLL